MQTDAKLSGTVALTAAPEGLQFALNGAAPADLFSLLPAAYTGAVEQIRAELDALVGLAPVKEYVFGLADNLQVQQRRAAAGFKTASLSMHMIFTGNSKEKVTLPGEKKAYRLYHKGTKNAFADVIALADEKLPDEFVGVNMDPMMTETEADLKDFDAVLLTQVVVGPKAKSIETDTFKIQKHPPQQLPSL